MKKLLRQSAISLIALLCVLSVANAQTVVSGDTMWKIAQNAGLSLTELIGLNPQVENPSLIRPGDEINTGSLGLAPIDVIALYEDSLQSSISNSATSMTLVRGTDQQGTSLSGTYGFIIDEGTTLQEFVIATCSGTACSSMKRGISVSDGNTEVSALKFAHRRGATVKMTDYPLLGRLNAMLNGTATTSGNLLFGNGKISGLYNLNGTFDWLKFNTSTSMLQWSSNGLDYYNFTSSSITQLTASSTKGIGVTDSNVYVNASSTLGMSFDSSGRLYQKTTTGLSNSSNGIGINYSNDNTWTGSNTFNGTTTLATTTFSVLPIGATGFGGTGLDGDLTITAGTTTIDLNGLDFFEKNYNNITINGTGTLSFLNPSASGTIVSLKVKNNFTMSASSTIYLVGIGATSTNKGSGFYTRTQVGNSGNGSTAGAAGTGIFNTTSTLSKNLNLYVGSAGGNGSGRNAPIQYNTGGRGGGALLLQVAGNWNFLGSINASGENGKNAYGVGGGGENCADGAGGNSWGAGTSGQQASASCTYVYSSGGGGGGTVIGIYNNLINNTGTINVSGGVGGNVSSPVTSVGGNGGVGYYSIFKNDN